MLVWQNRIVLHNFIYNKMTMYSWYFNFYFHAHQLDCHVIIWSNLNELNNNHTNKTNKKRLHPNKYNERSSNPIKCNPSTKRDGKKNDGANFLKIFTALSGGSHDQTQGPFEVKKVAPIPERRPPVPTHIRFKETSPTSK